MSPPVGRRGVHLLADLYGVDADLLADIDWLRNVMHEAANAAHALVINQHFHAFGAGLGVTGVMLLAESHLSVHTWPESNYAAFDIFMCGEARPQLALDVLLQAMAPRHRDIREIARG